ncbi:MAG: inositol-3-phosphate synthase [Thermodesulfobacteriota bacterium]
MEHHPSSTQPLVILVAGIGGAIGSTLCLAVETLKSSPELVLPYLTTEALFPNIPPADTHVAGWDLPEAMDLNAALRRHGVVPEAIHDAFLHPISAITVFKAPSPELGLNHALNQVCRDIQTIQSRHPNAAMVLVNLLPAAPQPQPAPDSKSLAAWYATHPVPFPDLVYALAAIESGIPVVNFTPNGVEMDWVVDRAVQQGVPMCGRDGKTGQTFYKQVLASAWKARKLKITGWYSLNILGNADGANLMNPACASGKIANKTEILEEILGYPLPPDCHKVHIDYYPPRGDAKEAWDVIDFEGLFGLPMSMRIDFQGRDSVLAAPMVMDLARWMTVLHQKGKRRGLVPELAFFFKKPLGNDPPVSFPDQLLRLAELSHSWKD